MNHQGGGPLRRARQLESGACKETHQGKAGGGQGQGQDCRGGFAGTTCLYLYAARYFLSFTVP